MPAKKAKKTSRIECLDIDAANRLSLEIATELREAHAIRLELEESIQALKKAASKKLAARAKKAKELAGSIYEFAARYQANFAESDQRSVMLISGGTFGWRTSPGILEIKDAEAAIAKLEGLGFDTLVRIEKSVDKETLKRFPDVIKMLDGVSLDYPETFFIKPPETDTRLECAVEGKHVFSIIQPKKES